MNKIMVINCGSSTVKFKMFNEENNNFEVVTEGVIDRIGQNAGAFEIKYNGEELEEDKVFSTHAEGIEYLLNKLIELNIINSLEEISMVGHRVVQGGEDFKESVLVDDAALEKIYELKKLAPLHNVPNGDGIAIFKKMLPNAKNVAVFDTVFHQTMEPVEYIYPLPYSLYREHQLRRYGMHGTNHKYVVNKLIEHKNTKDLKIISCHIGAGASICAVENGKCVTISMGLTPLGGIMMATRCGDIDPSILKYIHEQTGKDFDEIDTMLNKQSGLLGVSEISADGREIMQAFSEGNEQAILTVNMFVNRIVDFIASYAMKLGGLDAIIFTAGIGENDSIIRQMVVDKLALLNVKIDDEKNKIRSKELRAINTSDSNVEVYVIPANEELQIAYETLELCK